MLKMFAMIDAGERAGSGISKIFYGWEEAGYAAPTYTEEFDPDRTILTLPLVEVNNLCSPDDARLVGKNNNDGFKQQDNRRVVCDQLSENERIAIELAEEQGRVTTIMLSERANISKLTAGRILKGLVEKNILSWQGRNLTDPLQHYELT